MCLDTELMPWSAKAQKLLTEQYASVGCAGQSGLMMARRAVNEAIDTLGDKVKMAAIESDKNLDLASLQERLSNRSAYSPCWRWKASRSIRDCEL